MTDAAVRWRVTAAVGIGIFMATLDSSIVNISLPTISEGFGIGIAVAQWVSLAYLITVAALLLPAGRLADLVGRSRTYLAGMVLFTLSSLVCGMAPSAGALIAARALQALGSALIMATGMALLTDAWPPAKRGQAMGIGGITVSVGLMTGPPLGGLISGELGWRWIFYVNLPVGVIGVLLAALALRGLTETRGKLKSFDIPGALLLGGFMVALCLGLTFGPTRGWRETQTIALLAVAPFLLATFLLRQATTAQPMLSLAIFRNRTFSSAAGAALISFTGQFPVFLLLPFYLQGVLGYSEKATGLTIFVVPLTTALLAFPAGKLSDRVGSRWPTVAAMAIRGSCYGLMLLFGSQMASWQILLPLFLLAFGNAAFGPANNSALMGSVPAEHRGVAASIASAMRSLGMVIGAASGTAIAAAKAVAVQGDRANAVFNAAQNPEGFVQGFHASLIFSICCAALAALAAAARPNDAGRMSALMSGDAVGK